MTGAKRQKGRGKPRPFALPQLPEDLLAYVREHLRLGQRMNREVTMTRLGVSREQFDKAKLLVGLEFCSASERAEFARKFLVDYEVFKIIEDDLKASRADRRSKRAVIVHKGLLNDLQGVETELREAAKADRAQVASMKAQRELLRIAAYIDAIRMGIDDMSDPQRVIAALHRVDAQVGAVLEKVEAASAESSYVVVDGEAWQADLSRALS